MVAIFNKEMMSWYLITLKLRETMETQIPKSPDGTRSIDLPLSQPSNPTDPDSGWIISIKEKLDHAYQEDLAGSWLKLSIYRIPHYLKDDDNKAYVPQFVSLGPYHNSRPELHPMECHKWRALYHMLKRTRHNICVYLDAVRELEDRARSCYEGVVYRSSNEFVEMMVVDGSFVLELLRGAAEGFKELGYPRNDPIFAIRGSMHSIHRDMIMLENQIPIFILDTLLGIQLNKRNLKGFVAALAIRFFDPLMPNDKPETEGDGVVFDPLTDDEGLHFLDIFRRSLLRAGPKPNPKIRLKRGSNVARVADKRQQQLIHCVSELKEAGVRFVRRKAERFWDIKFSNGCLRMPRLLIHDGTKSLFLNLIAFEQCHPDCTNDITSYVIFMDNLINSPEDVAYLHYVGIIEHWLGSDAEVAELFNKLCQEVVFDMNDSYLSSLSEEINRYYNHRWNAWRASLKHNYFSNPWSTISFLAAVVLLILTFTQTFYSIYQYYKPRI